MTPTVGFVLLTHARPRMIRRLADRLGQMFGGPPVVCHHDFSKCDLPVEEFPPNVSFVRPHTVTGWGEFATTEATVRAIRQLYEGGSGPDWFVLLSGADYPVKPAASILEDLRSADCDAFIHHEPIRAGAFENDWQGLCHWRYCAPEPNPFTPEFRCFAGSQWFTAGRRAAEHIIAFHEKNPDTVDRFRGLKLTEECYFQCVLANEPRLRLRNESLRYTDWSAGGSHPKTLTTEDLSALLATRAHFARKFDDEVDARVLDELDAIIGA